MNQKAIQGMDTKKEKIVASKEASGRKVISFVAEVKQELQRVDWTSKEELKGYTKIVVASMFLFGFCIYFIDLFIRGFLGAINLFVKLLTG